MKKVLSFTNLISLSSFLVFSVLMTIIAVIILNREEAEKAKLSILLHKKAGPKPHVWAISAAVCGFTAGSFGIAGGVLLMPLMLHFKMPARTSVVTVNFIVIFTAFSTTLRFIQLGFFNV